MKRLGGLILVVLALGAGVAEGAWETERVVLRPHAAEKARTAPFPRQTTLVTWVRVGGRKARAEGSPCNYTYRAKGVLVTEKCRAHRLVYKAANFTGRKVTVRVGYRVR